MTETASERRAPHSRRESVSRPNSSVPAQCVADGLSSRWTRSIAEGLSGAIQGAARPARKKATQQDSSRHGQRLAANEFSNPAHFGKRHWHSKNTRRRRRSSVLAGMDLTLVLSFGSWFCVCCWLGLWAGSTRR